jgi:hypothetical protein
MTGVARRAILKKPTTLAAGWATMIPTSLEMNIQQLLLAKKD